LSLSHCLKHVSLTPHYSLHPKAIIGNFMEVIKNRQFMTYAIVGNTFSAALFA
jgi:DHA1 family bicyclomycin/chloramphenicol resistance-like MFS transporter